MDSLNSLIRTLVYIDFDNIMRGLYGANKAVALSFANNISSWLSYWKTYDLPDGTAREFVDVRVYLDPSSWVKVASTQSKPARRLHFDTFFKGLEESGVKIIKCPSITRRHKNAADMYLVVDAMKYMMESPDSFDEVIVMSSDSDFTPLLKFIQGINKRTIVMSSDRTSNVYRSFAHRCVEVDELVLSINTSLSRVQCEPKPDTREKRGPSGVKRARDKLFMLPLSRSDYAHVLEVLAEHVLDSGFKEGQSSFEICQKLRTRGVNVGVRPVSYMAFGISYHLSLAPGQQPNAEVVRDAHVEALLFSSRKKGIPLCSEMVDDIQEYLAG
jgi:uncharacterized LabA/DUF88 family protein